ncbi:MAG TPA: universal stress protein [Dehalococcoidia bacterium]|nr:universal stress protein [Dehalococcoidia bacterium]
MFESILVPLDGSDYAAKALDTAASLANYARRLTLVRVVHTFDELMGTRQPDLLDNTEKSEDMLAREAYEDEHNEAQSYLERTKASLSGQPFEVGLVLAEGSPADEIMRVAREVNADLIVITAYGLSASSTPAKTGVFGKVADKVLRDAHVPVLVVKPWG